MWLLFPNTHCTILKYLNSTLIYFLFQNLLLPNDNYITSEQVLKLPSSLGLKVDITFRGLGHSKGSQEIPNTNLDISFGAKTLSHKVARVFLGGYSRVLQP